MRTKPGGLNPTPSTLLFHGILELRVPGLPGPCPL